MTTEMQTEPRPAFLEAIEAREAAARARRTHDDPEESTAHWLLADLREDAREIMYSRAREGARVRARVERDYAGDLTRELAEIDAAIARAAAAATALDPQWNAREAYDRDPKRWEKLFTNGLASPPAQVAGLRDGKRAREMAADLEKARSLRATFAAERARADAVATACEADRAALEARLAAARARRCAAEHAALTAARSVLVERSTAAEARAADAADALARRDAAIATFAEDESDKNWRAVDGAAMTLSVAEARARVAAQRLDAATAAVADAERAYSAAVKDWEPDERWRPAPLTQAAVAAIDAELKGRQWAVYQIGTRAGDAIAAADFAAQVAETILKGEG